MGKKRKLRWFSRFSRSSGFAKAILQDTVNRKEEEVDRKRDWKTIIKSRQGCALPAETRQVAKGLLRSHPWYPNDLARLWDNME